MAWTLAVSAAATLLAGLLFARVGWRLRARAAELSEGRVAMRAFSAWWLGIGASTACVAGMAFVGLGAAPSVALVVALRAASLVLLSIALAGILTHVAYVYTGRDRSRAIAAAYALLALAVVAHLLWSRPVALDVTAWTVETRALREPLPGSTGILIGAYLLPPIVASALYLGLLRRAGDPVQRRRILIVGVGIFAWVFASLLARASDAPLWQFVTRVALGTAVALSVERAYSLPPPSARAGADDGLRTRILQLV